MINAVRLVWGSLDRIIMCMSHNERMLNGPGGLDFSRVKGNLVFRYVTSLLWKTHLRRFSCTVVDDDRNSDDFNLQYSDNHSDFIKWNVYSTILTRHLSFVPDFDMFSSTPDSRWPACHALLRALGPGPTLLSDLPGTPSNIAIIDRLSAKIQSGEIKVVKMRQPATVPSVRWFWDNIQGAGDGPGLVASSRAPEAAGALIAVWNIRKAEGGGMVRDRIGIEEVNDAIDGNLAADHVLWKVGLSGPSLFSVITLEWSGLEIQLDRAGCELFVSAKIWDIGGTRVSILGMLSKYAPLAGLRVSEDRGEFGQITSVSLLMVRDPPCRDEIRSRRLSLGMGGYRAGACICQR